MFDAVADAQAAAAEIARVLAPGGRFVHLLDMATLLEQPFAKLAGSGLVPIPNVFGDPGDHEWPLDIVLLRARLAGEPAALRGRRRPSVRRGVRADLRAVPAPAAVRRRRGRDERVQGDRGQRRAAAHAGGAADVGQPPVGRARATAPSSRCPFTPAATCRACSATSFAAAGFAVELSEIVARAIRRPAADDEKTLRYRSLCVGHERLEGELPRRLLAGRPSRRRDGDILVEAGVFAFVAALGRLSTTRYARQGVSRCASDENCLEELPEAGTAAPVWAVVRLAARGAEDDRVVRPGSRCTARS